MKVGAADVSAIEDDDDDNGAFEQDEAFMSMLAKLQDLDIIQYSPGHNYRFSENFSQFLYGEEDKRTPWDCMMNVWTAVLDLEDGTRLASNIILAYIVKKNEMVLFDNAEMEAAAILVKEIADIIHKQKKAYSSSTTAPS